MKRKHQPNYLPKLLKATESVTAPGMHHVTVYHDDWCHVLKGTGPCNCNPVVEQAVSHREWLKGRK